jgi:hypothetical protein
MSTTASASDASETLRCARHPHTETVLRCGRCDTPICPQCMVMSPVGARCPSCAQVKRFALMLKPIEVARAIAFGLVVAAVGSVIATLIPFLGPLFGFAIVGFAVGEVVSIGGNRKRVPALAPIAVGCLLIGYVLGFAILLMTRGAPLALAIGAPLQAAFGNLFLLAGLGVGALLAWMRTR